MSARRGHAIALSPARRMMGDLMDVSRRVPLVTQERRLYLAPLVEARQQLAERPSWFTLFIKGYGLVAEKRPELRQSYLTFPYERIYQHPYSVAGVAIARRVGEEEVVLPLSISKPERRTLAQIDEVIRRSRTDPIETIPNFDRYLRLGWYPRWIRRWIWWSLLNVSGRRRCHFSGTFGITCVAALGSNLLNVLSPMTTTLTYDVMEPDGSLMVRMFLDHRVLDGVQPAAALAELEAAMNGPIADELRGMAGRQSLAA